MQHKISRRHVLVGAVAAGTGLQAWAQSQTPLSLVVGFPPGGSTDTMARMLADRLRVKLGRPVVVENVPGAANRLAMQRVKRAAPDGSTLIFTPVGATSVLPHLYTAKNLGYVAEDYVPVARVATFEYVLAAGLSVKATNMQELKAWLQANPTAATVANPGTGTVPHLLSIVLADEMKVPVTYVPYRGTTPAIPDLMGGNVSIMIGTPLDFLSHHQSGKLRVLGAISDKRSPTLPDVPTLKEQGIALSADSFHGIWAPAGTPSSVVRTLNSAIVSILNEPALREEILQKFSLHAAPSSPAELDQAAKEDTKLWANFVKRSGIAMTD